MKNLVSTPAAVLMMAAAVGTAVAQSGFTYKPYGAPLGSPGYQPTSGHPSSAFNYGGGYHTNSHGGFITAVSAVRTLAAVTRTSSLATGTAHTANVW